MKLSVSLSLFIICLCIYKISTKSISQHSKNGESYKPVTVLGLYNASDKVIILTGDTFQDNVFNNEFASIIEFYNTFCGHCKRYAPIWKQIASDLHSWHDILHVSAVDCADNVNNDLCRDYNITLYPTIRYFSPNLEESENVIGDKFEKHDVKAVRSEVARRLKKENKAPENWPTLIPLPNNTSIENLPRQSSVNYFFLIYNKLNISTVPVEIILDFHYIKEIAIREINLADVAHNFGLNDDTILTVIDQNLQLTALPTENLNRTNIRKSIKNFLIEKGFTSEIINPTTTEVNPTEKSVSDIKNVEVIEIVKTMQPTVFQADLEQAVQYSLFHEISQLNVISGERMTALQRYMNVLQR